MSTKRKPTEKGKLTDRFVRSAERVPKKGRKDWWDDQVPNFGLRVTANGARSYVMYLRWPGSGANSRRAIGDASKMSLAAARDRAREWHALVSRGVDPRDEARRIRAAEARERAVTFAGVAEDYIAESLADKRRGAVDAREIRREIVPRWGSRPVTQITRDDVLELVRAVKSRGHAATARLVLSHVKRMFKWALHQPSHRYGIEQNPAFFVSPKLAVGEKKPRQRVLDDDELRALWRACLRTGYPAGDCVRLILLTGCRLGEIAEARWRELDPHKMLLTIPPARFKSDSEHLVPLSGEAEAIVQTLPRHKKGDCMFTTTFGEKPINGWSRAKSEIDRRMLRSLRALARLRGLDPAEVVMPRWVIHDLRHVVRTRMAELRVPDNVAEMIIGHGKKGMQRVYDQHKYESEMREAAEAWAGMLRETVAHWPAPTVVPMTEKPRKRTRA
jgi:integrase